MSYWPLVKWHKLELSRAWSVISLAGTMMNKQICNSGGCQPKSYTSTPPMQKITTKSSMNQEDISL